MAPGSEPPADRPVPQGAVPGPPRPGPPQPGPPQPGPPQPGPPRPRTSNASVTAALEELDGVPGRPLLEHPDAFARVHAGLQRALADIDDA